MTLLLVIVGGAVGAPARYLTDLAVQRLQATAFPWGTWTANVTGSFLLGLVTSSGPDWALTLVGTGFCGALTTFSTFGYETVRLSEERSHAAAAANVAGSIAGGLTAAALGWWFGSGF
jgi:fluoride exporter